MEKTDESNSHKQCRCCCHLATASVLLRVYAGAMSNAITAALAASYVFTQDSTNLSSGGGMATTAAAGSYSSRCRFAACQQAVMWPSSYPVQCRTHQDNFSEAVPCQWLASGTGASIHFLPKAWPTLCLVQIADEPNDMLLSLIAGSMNMNLGTSTPLSL